LLGASAVAWPLVAAGVLKIAYDLALLVAFRAVKPPEEVRMDEATRAKHAASPGDAADPRVSP
jgi:hypothetical protein